MRPKYNVGDNVSCLWGGSIVYQAKIVRYDPRKGAKPYHVHYQGWNNRWNEWVSEGQLTKIDDPKCENSQEERPPPNPPSPPQKKRGRKRKHPTAEAVENIHNAPLTVISRPMRKAEESPKRQIGTKLVSYSPPPKIASPLRKKKRSEMEKPVKPPVAVPAGPPKKKEKEGAAVRGRPRKDSGRRGRNDSACSAADSISFELADASQDEGTELEETHPTHMISPTSHITSIAASLMVEHNLETPAALGSILDEIHRDIGRMREQRQREEDETAARALEELGSSPLGSPLRDPFKPPLGPLSTSSPIKVPSELPVIGNLTLDEHLPLYDIDDVDPHDLSDIICDVKQEIVDHVMVGDVLPASLRQPNKEIKDEQISPGLPEEAKEEKVEKKEPKRETKTTRERTTTPVAKKKKDKQPKKSAKVRVVRNPPSPIRLHQLRPNPNVPTEYSYAHIPFVGAIGNKEVVTTPVPSTSFSVPTTTTTVPPIRRANSAYTMPSTSQGYSLSSPRLARPLSSRPTTLYTAPAIPPQTQHVRMTVQPKKLIHESDVLPNFFTSNEKNRRKIHSPYMGDVYEDDDMPIQEYYSPDAHEQFVDEVVAEEVVESTPMDPSSFPDVPNEIRADHCYGIVPATGRKEDEEEANRPNTVKMPETSIAPATYQTIFPTSSRPRVVVPRQPVSSASLIQGAAPVVVARHSLPGGVAPKNYRFRPVPPYPAVRPAGTTPVRLVDSRQMRPVYVTQGDRAAPTRKITYLAPPNRSRLIIHRSVGPTRY